MIKRLFLALFPSHHNLSTNMAWDLSWSKGHKMLPLSITLSLFSQRHFYSMQQEKECNSKAFRSVCIIDEVFAMWHLSSFRVWHLINKSLVPSEFKQNKSKSYLCTLWICNCREWKGSHCPNISIATKVLTILKFRQNQGTQIFENIAKSMLITWEGLKDASLI